MWQGFNINCMPSVWEAGLNSTLFLKKITNRFEGGCPQFGGSPSLPSTICPQTLHLPAMQCNFHTCIQVPFLENVTPVQCPWVPVIIPVTIP